MKRLPTRFALRASSFLAALFLLCVVPASAQNIAGTIFHSTCAECHGADGGGRTPKGQAGKIPDMRSAEIQKQTDEQLAGIILNGRRSSRGLNYSMPANKGKLTNDQIQQLVAYIRSIAKGVE